MGCWKQENPNLVAYVHTKGSEGACLTQLLEDPLIVNLRARSLSHSGSPLLEKGAERPLVDIFLHNL